MRAASTTCKEVRDLRRTSIKGTGLTVELTTGSGGGVIAMTIGIRQINPAFAGEVSGVDITRPIGAMRLRRSRRAWTAMPFWCSATSA